MKVSYNAAKLATNPTAKNASAFGNTVAESASAFVKTAATAASKAAPGAAESASTFVKTAATSAATAAPGAAAAAKDAVSQVYSAAKGSESKGTPANQSSWFTRRPNAENSSKLTRKNKESSTPEKKGWWPTRNKATDQETKEEATPEEKELAKKFLEKVRSGELSAESLDVKPETVPTPEEETLTKKFLAKVRKGDLTEVVQSINGVKSDDDLTVFQQIKQQIKDGNFTDIVKSLPSPPAFPTDLVKQILGTLNDIFQQNIGKVTKLAEVSIDYELERKKNDLELNKLLGAEATKTKLGPHMPAYINHIVNQ